MKDTHNRVFECSPLKIWVFQRTGPVLRSLLGIPLSFWVDITNSASQCRHNKTITSNEERGHFHLANYTKNETLSIYPHVFQLADDRRSMKFHFSL